MHVEFTENDEGGDVVPVNPELRGRQNDSQSNLPLSAFDTYNLYSDLSGYFSGYGFFFKSDVASFTSEVLQQPKVPSLPSLSLSQHQHQH